MLSNNDIAAMSEHCRHCGDHLVDDDGALVDETGGDVCGSRFEAGDLPHERLIEPSDVRFAICRRCRGSGELGGYPGVYTSDDFAEDPDFAEDYMNYRRPCEDCHEHPGRVRVLTDGALARPEVAAWINEIASSYEISRQERMYGA